MITALIVAVVLVSAALAALVVAAALLGRPHGRHRADSLADAPAPEARPGQAPRPGDPPSANGAVRAGATHWPPGLPLTAPGTAPETPALRGAARAGQATGAGAPPSPAAATAAPPAEAATLPRPDPAFPVAVTSPGPGRHPFAPVIMQFPGGEVGILGADGTWRIKPLAWQPGVRETGAQPALVRPGRSRFEAWQDEAVNQ